MKQILGIFAATLLAGSAFAQPAANPLQNTQPQQQRPLMPWQRPAAQQPAQPAAPAAPATVTRIRPPAAAPAATAAGQTGREAARTRQKQCGAEWRADPNLKAQYGSWPKYWSACNTRIKTTGR